MTARSVLSCASLFSIEQVPEYYLNNKNKRKVMLLRILMFTCLFYTSSLLAGSTQPSVAIKDPIVGDGVSKSLRKILDINQIRSEMEASFRATRKFRVLSRDKATLNAILDEQNFAQSDFAKGDAADKGELSNANYLIIPTVTDFIFYRSHKALPNFDDKYKRTDSGRLLVSAQMLDTSTGQIVTTFSLKSTFATKAAIVNGKGGRPSSVYFTKMAKGVAAKLATQFVAQVYPMKVIKRTANGQLIINRGQDGGLKKGDKLAVFSAGEELIDPDTGESLGSSEEYIGDVTVTRINPKITFVKIVKEIDAVNTPMTRGSILRRPQ